MLASAAGVTQNAIFHIETGDVNPQLSSLQGIAKDLRCTVRELLCGKPDAARVSPLSLPACFACWNRTMPPQ